MEVVKMSDFQFLMNYFKQDTLTSEEISEVKKKFAAIKSGNILFDINAADETGNTLLHYACMNNHIYFFKELAEFSPNLKKKNHDGDTAFHFACLSMQGEKVFNALNSIFLASYDLGAKKSFWEQKNLKYQSPLFYAVQVPEGLKALLEMGVEPNIFDNEGYTPLYGATREGNVEAIKLLLAFGANPHIHVSDAYEKSDNLLQCVLRDVSTEAAAQFFINLGFAIGRDLPEEIFEMNLNFDYAFLFGASVEGKPITPEQQGCELAICNAAQIRLVRERLDALLERYQNFDRTGKLEEDGANQDGMLILSCLKLTLSFPNAEFRLLVERIESEQKKASEEEKKLSLLTVFQTLKESINYLNTSQKQEILKKIFSFPREAFYLQLKKCIHSGILFTEELKKEIEQVSVVLGNNLFELTALKIYFDPSFDKKKNQLLELGHVDLMRRFNSLFFNPITALSGKYKVNMYKEIVAQEFFSKEERNSCLIYHLECCKYALTENKARLECIGEQSQIDVDIETLYLAALAISEFLDKKFVEKALLANKLQKIELISDRAKDLFVELAARINLLVTLLRINLSKEDEDLTEAQKLLVTQLEAIDPEDYQKLMKFNLQINDFTSEIINKAQNNVSLEF